MDMLEFKTPLWRRTMTRGLGRQGEYIRVIPPLKPIEPNEPRRWILRDIMLPFAVSRLALIVIAWAAMTWMPRQYSAAQWQLSDRGRMVPGTAANAGRSRPMTNMWSRWDGGWYYSIAKHGYNFTPGQPSNAAFFPLYPMLMRGAHLLIQSKSDAGWFHAGVLVSNVALLVALGYFYLLVRMDYDEVIARRAVLYVLVFPMTLFLSAVYAESVFLAAAIAAFYYARNGRWWLAGMLGCAAALSRPPGCIIFFGLAAEYFIQTGYSWRKIRSDALPLLLVPIGVLAYAVFLRVRAGAGSAFIQSQQAWGLHLQPPWRTIAAYLQTPFRFTHGVSHPFTDLMFTLTFGLLVAAVAMRLRRSYGFYALAYYAFITTWGSLESVPRYVLGIFPAIIYLAIVGSNRKLHLGYLITSGLLAALFMVMFAQWEWVA